MRYGVIVLAILSASSASAETRRKAPTPEPTAAVAPTPARLICTDPYRDLRRAALDVEGAVDRVPDSIATLVAYRRDVGVAVSRMNTEQKMAPPLPRLVGKEPHQPAAEYLLVVVDLMLLDTVANTAITFGVRSSRASTDPDVVKWFGEVLSARRSTLDALNALTSCDATSH